MARVFTDGAEHADATWFWSGGSVTGGGRSGSYYWSAGGTKYFPRPLSEFYFRFATNRNATYGAYITFGYNGTGCINYCINTTGQTFLQVGGSIVVTGALPQILPPLWCLREIYIKVADSGGRLMTVTNGLPDIDYTGDTKYSTYDTINYFYIGDPSGGFGTGYDDFALNDTTGSSDCGWCGDGRIVMVLPGGNGAHNNWDGSDGNKTDNYLLVDERPHTSDTDYVTAAITSAGTQDQYNMGAFTPSPAIITRIQPMVAAKKTTSIPTAYLKVGILPSGGSDLLCPSGALTSGYVLFQGQEYKINPVDSGAWEAADIDALELIIEVGNPSSTKMAYMVGV